jgi:hypothetical protein
MVLDNTILRTMRHLDFDDPEIQEKLSRAYPDLSPAERAEVLVDLTLFVRALAGLVDDTSKTQTSGKDSGSSTTD